MDESNLLDKPRSVIVIPNLHGIQQTCLSGSHRELGSKQNWPLQSQNTLILHTLLVVESLGPQSSFKNTSNKLSNLGAPHRIGVK